LVGRSAIEKEAPFRSRQGHRILKRASSLQQLKRNNSYSNEKKYALPLPRPVHVQVIRIGYAVGPYSSPKL